MWEPVLCGGAIIVKPDIVGMFLSEHVAPEDDRLAKLAPACIFFVSEFSRFSLISIILRFQSPIDGQVYAILNALSVFVGGWINGLAEFSLRVAEL